MRKYVYKVDIYSISFITVGLWEHFNDSVLPVSLVELKGSLVDKVSIRFREVMTDSLVMTDNDIYKK